VEGEPKRPESPREQKVPPRINRSGSKRGTRLTGREKAAGAPVSSSERFDRKAPERRERRETFFRSFCRRKALKGEAQECWRLKEASKGVTS
jgi:hypothetical protein